MLFAVTLGLFAAGTVAIPAASSMICNADNCLRAVRATQRMPTGAIDCSSYFRTTVTPAVVTVTATTTAHVTATVTNNVIETDTIFQTATYTLHTTTIETIPVTTTTQVTQYSAGIAKRQQTVIPSVIPLYASACSGAVRYSSACSCIGVTATTITTVGKTVTVTVDTIVTDSTKTVTTTVGTDSVTIVDFTVTTVQTDATATQYITVATTTAITYIGLQDRFYLQIQDSGLVGQYLYTSSSGRIAAGLSNQHTPEIFYIQNGNLYANGQPASTIGGWIATYGASQVILPSSGIALGYDNVPVAIDGDDFTFFLVTDENTAAKSWICVDEPEWGGVSGLALSLPSNTYLKYTVYCTLVTFKAVPVPF
ncbi:hypothetical protein TWF694_008165 [Orbilia ellipsospora]|uniref:Uncharacterized protein n=1 Tax=Orbilia ellipsospora TaxID=2528407 RepID=A0AAV9XF90_9PEZI